MHLDVGQVLTDNRENDSGSDDALTAGGCTRVHASICVLDTVKCQHAVIVGDVEGQEGAVLLLPTHSGLRLAVSLAQHH